MKKEVNQTKTSRLTFNLNENYFELDITLKIGTPSNFEYLYEHGFMYEYIDAVLNDIYNMYSKDFRKMSLKVFKNVLQVYTSFHDNKEYYKDLLEVNHEKQKLLQKIKDIILYIEALIVNEPIYSSDDVIIFIYIAKLLNEIFESIQLEYDYYMNRLKPGHSFDVVYNKEFVHYDKLEELKSYLEVIVNKRNEELKR